MLGPGDPVPPLTVRSCSNPRYALGSAAGRYVVLVFVASTKLPGVQAFLDRLYADPDLFDDETACCYVVINDPADEKAGILADRFPGVRVIWDLDRSLARFFGCIEQGPDQAKLYLTTYVLDAGQRVHSVLPFEQAPSHYDKFRSHIEALPGFDPAGMNWAPVLTVPGVIEPELCRAFIAYSEREGLEDSGYMKTDPATGQTVLVVDHAHKMRRDCTIEDADLRNALQARIVRRLIPQIERAFQFKATRMERYLCARYDAGGGWFRPHRDNTTLGTAHRRFAVSINLNAEDYEGGDLRFPEFGRRTYRAPTGGAVVFSCSMLHEATPVIRGRRYCLLPFLYDEIAAQVRLENARHISDPQLAESVVKSVLAAPGWFEKSAAA